MSLPPYVMPMKGALYYRWRIKKKSRYLRLPDIEHPDFSAVYASAEQLRMRMQAEARAPKPIAPNNFRAVRRWNARAVNATGDRTVPTWLMVLAREARKRSSRRTIEFTLTIIDLSLLAQRSNGTCEVTGIEFRFEKQAGSLYRPFAPSMDRIDPAQGYTFRNVRLVCVIVNAALNQWGEGPFWEMVTAAACNTKGVPEGYSLGLLEKEPDR